MKLSFLHGALWALTLGAVPLMAQPAAPRHVDVFGTAEIRVLPDEAVVTLGVESWASELAAARKDNDARMARLLAVPSRYGVDPKNVKTDFVRIEPQYEMGDRGQTLSIQGYRVVKTVVVVLKEVARCEAFVTEALQAGANRLDDVSFGLADPTGLRAQARLDALRSAKAKAEALAKELGQKLGRALAVSEVPSSSPVGPMYKMANSLAFAGGEDAGGSTLAPGQVVVSAQISVQFELVDR